jgi:peptidyl-prolyl cis-trans isomerase B (cyclophilin B)
MKVNYMSLWERWAKTQLWFKFLIITVMLLLCLTGTTLAFAQNDDKIVIFHTEFGHLAIELFSDDAPNTTENFLKLAESGFYDETIFHRIIKGFMIQGGDPNSKDSDQSKWGQGDAGYDLAAEFNNLVHERGIVSMARSTHPDSAGSQFFIVHEKSTFLDEKYTVFGRIITFESYDTLDKIANLEVTAKSVPIQLEKAKITKTEVVKKSSLENLPFLLTPERIETTTIKDISRYSNAEYGFSFMPQKGWMLQEGGLENSDSVVLVALGLEKDGNTPSIIFEAFESNDTTLEEFFEPRLEKYHELDDGSTFDILSEEYRQIAGYNGLEIIAVQTLNQSDTLKFKQAILEGTNFHYVISYANLPEYFDDGLVGFDNITDSFLITQYAASSNTNPEGEVIVLDDKSFNETENGGCLIATATFGTEMAPQVQFLREIRDNIVLQTESGTSFMAGFNQFYYSFSPTIADYERENPIFKEGVKLAITPLLASLTLLQFADIDSESEMLGYGIGIILLNVGIYFAIPAAFIMKIRKLQ